MYEPLISRRLPVARRRFVVAVSVLGAYGNSGGSDDGGSGDLLSTEEAAQFELWSGLAQRMRENGMEGFPDPEVSEDGFMLIGAPLDPGHGQPLLDWVASLVSGEPVDDVHCTECTGG